MGWLAGWTPDAVSSPDFIVCRSHGVSTSESTSQVPVLLCYLSSFGWLPEGVASQKNLSNAGDVPSLAPQHTFSARKEPKNNGLAVWLLIVR